MLVGKRLRKGTVLENELFTDISDEFAASFNKGGEVVRLLRGVEVSEFVLFNNSVDVLALDLAALLEHLGNQLEFFGIMGLEQLLAVLRHGQEIERNAAVLSLLFVLDISKLSF